MAEATASQESTQESATPAEAGVEVNEAQLPNVADTGIKGAAGQIDVLLNMPVMVSAVLGQADIQVRQLLEFAQGSVVKLNRRVGEPVDLFMKGVRFATGQLVVMGEHLGVRIKEILPGAVQETDD